MQNKSIHGIHKLGFIIVIHYYLHMGVGEVEEEEQEE